MVTELVLDSDSERLKTAAVERLARAAPSGMKCIFLNCEMQDSASGMAMSDDLFAVVKPLFGRAKRIAIDLDPDTFKLLTDLGRRILANMNQDHVILDVVVDGGGVSRAFSDDGPLRRLSGGERGFRGKHKAYVHVEPWLAEID